MPELHDLAPLYAVGALEPDEERRFLDHLDTCVECRDELVIAERGIEALAVSSAEPAPADMRDEVMRRIEAAQHPSTKVVPFPRRRVWQTVAGVAAAAAVAFAVLFFNAQNQLDSARQLEEILAAGDLVTVAVEDSPIGAARFVYSAELGRGVFTGIGLELVPDDRTYQLWLIDESGPVSAGVFRPDAEGDAVVVVEGELGSGVVLGVTVEPAGGSPQPTGEVLIARELT